MYVKIFSDILQSSIWAEDPETKVVWLTMLCLSDQDGMVRATAPGISHEARVSLERTKEILSILESPDPDSRTPDNEGRRIERMDGGYFVLNYTKYREMCDPNQRREYMRGYMKNYRARKQSLAPVNVVNESEPKLAQAEAEAEAKKNKHSIEQARLCIEIIEDLNRRTGKRFRTKNEASARLIQSRLNDGFTKEDFLAVHAAKVQQWITDPKMSPYLRPPTLYGPKFESYLNEVTPTKAPPVVNPETGEGETWGRGTR